MEAADPARGLEFSTTPLPVLRRDAFLSGRLFDEPTMTCVPAMGHKTVHYLALLARVPDGFGNVVDIAAWRTIKCRFTESRKNSRFW